MDKANHARAAIYCPNMIHYNILPVPEYSARDIQTCLIEGKGFKMYFCSLYLHTEMAVDMPIWIRLIKFCRDTQSKLLIGTDSNAHSFWWGCKNENPRGLILENTIMRENLTLHNVGSTPTWHNKINDSVIDLTLSIGNIHIENWRVAPGESFSDHRILEYNVVNGNTPAPAETLGRNYMKANWTTFQSIMSEIQPNAQSEWSEDTLESSSAYFYEYINSALDKVCPVKKIKVKDTGVWWNQDCHDAQQRAKVAERRAHKHRSRRPSNPTGELWENMRSTRREYKAVTANAKKTCWENFVKETDSLPAMAKLFKILQPRGQSQIGLLRKPDGSMCTDRMETLTTLLDSHFPGAELVKAAHSPNHSHRPLLDTPWINRERFKVAVNLFGSHKAAGKDGLKPIVFQKLPDESIDFLLNLYRASFTLSYSPEAWRESKVVFLAKPGKTDMSDTRSFRPISLTSFALKTFERLIIFWQDDTTFKLRPIIQTQYAFRKGKSTENALSATVTQIEKHLYRGYHVIALFIDIKGAFDQILADTIIKACRDYGIPETLCKWYEQYLLNRTALLHLEGETLLAHISRGGPQGSCMSPTFAWSIPFEILLKTLKDMMSFATGFADDGCTISAGWDLEVVRNDAQANLVAMSTWADNHGLTLCTKKSVAMFLTRKMDKTMPRKLTLYGNDIEYVSNTKYLGLIIDDKLSFAENFADKFKKSKTKMFASRGAIQQHFGPESRYARWAYTGIVRPGFTYGCMIWAHAITESQTRQMRSLQRLGLLQIAHVRRATPTRSLEIIYNIIPLDIHVRELAKRAFIRLQIQPNWTPTGPKGTKGTKGHLHYLQDLLPADLKHGIKLDEGIPVRNWDNRFSVVIGNGKDTNDSDIRCYTDGSLKDGCSGLGAVIYVEGDKIVTISERLTNNTTVYQAELAAILAAADYVLLTMRPHLKRIEFRVDNQASLKSLINTHQSKESVRRVCERLNALATSNTVVLTWIRAHVGNVGNEEADMAAKKGSESSRTYTTQTGGRPTHPHDFPTAKAVLHARLRATSMVDWHRQWTEYTRLFARQTFYFYKGPDPSKTTTLMTHTRSAIGRFARFLTGHAFLRRQNAIVEQRNPRGDIACRRCYEGPDGPDEEPSHVIASCNGLIGKRSEIFGPHITDREHIVYWEVTAMLQFLSLPEVYLLETDEE